VKMKMSHVPLDFQLKSDREIKGEMPRQKMLLTGAFVRRRSPILGLMACVSVLLSVPGRCLAQDDTGFHWFTFNGGGGWAAPHGTEASSLNTGWKNFDAGAGFAVTPPPAPGRKWSVFITANFMFEQLGVKQAALQDAIATNPTNIGLLEAASARAQFYSTTLDPTFRFPIAWRVSGYVFGGFGWLRRDLEFTGVSGIGSLLLPGSPDVFGSGGNSGAYDVGGGLNFRLPRQAGGLMIYAEARVTHGLAVNNATMLTPVSIGIRW
jgi:hypothetical protein